MSIPRFLRFWPLLSVLPLLGGCFHVRTWSSTSFSSSPSSANYANSLAPLPSGLGLLVCEPVVSGTKPDVANWGTGAAHWLQLHAAGQVELGKTPTWQTLGNVPQSLGARNLQLNKAQALQAGHLAGVTHVAIGTLAGEGANLKLAYELYDVAKGRIVFTWVVSAAPRSMALELPKLARQMASKLGVKSPQVPARLALAPEELAFLGSQPLGLHYRQQLAAADSKRLKALFAKDALAGVMIQRVCAYNSNWQALADTLAKQAPRNTLVWDEIADTGPERMKTLHTRLQALQAKYPNNYLLATARMQYEDGHKNRAEQVKWAEVAARAAPRNYVAWIELAQAQNDAAHQIRQGKFQSQMTWSEKRQIGVIYPKFEAAAQKATEVAPGESAAWSKLAYGATFNSDETIAMSALEKAVALDPSNGDAWSWGLQMTQAKWFGSTEQYMAFCTRAAAHADAFYFNASDASSVFTNAGQHAALKPVLEVVVQKDPQNPDALMELGAVYHYEDRSYPKAERLYKAALAVNPKHSRALSALGDLTYWVHGDSKGAEALYLRGIAANPSDGYIHANLGRMYALTGRQSQGVVEAQKAKSLGFSDGTHPVWAATGVSAS